MIGSGKKYLTRNKLDVSYLKKKFLFEKKNKLNPKLNEKAIVKYHRNFIRRSRNINIVRPIILKSSIKNLKIEWNNTE